MSKGRIKRIPMELISTKVAKYEFIVALLALPEDALFIGSEPNVMGGHDLVFSSEEWEDIEWGDVTPVFVPMVTDAEVDKLKRQLSAHPGNYNAQPVYLTQPEQDSFLSELTRNLTCICDMEYTGRIRHLPECPVKSLK